MHDRHEIHDRPELLAELVTRVEARLDREACLVEKDYWVTHTLDALQRAGLDVHFKGGTSLSKDSTSSNASRKTST